MATHSSTLAWQIPMEWSKMLSVQLQSQTPAPAYPLPLFWNKCYHTHTCVVLLWVVVQSLNSLWPHGLQHARLPCASPSPRDAQTQVLLWVNFLNICYYIYTQHFFLSTTLCFQDLSVLIYSNLVHSFSFLCFSWDQQTTRYFLILLLSVRIS